MTSGLLPSLLAKPADMPELSRAPAAAEPPTYLTGLDLGQAADFSALVVVERTKQDDPARPGRRVPHFAVRHLHRWALGTPYTAVVSDLKAMFAEAPLKGGTLVVDATGVGRGVVDMIRLAGLAATVRSYTITAGSQPGAGTVPKKDLVAAVQVALQERRVKFAESLELTPALVKELEHFRVKVTSDRNETFESWRERDHDDLVLALALALHVGGQPSGYAVLIDLPQVRKRPGPWGWTSGA